MRMLVIYPQQHSRIKECAKIKECASRMIASGFGPKAVSCSS